VDVFAAELSRRLGAEEISFLISDFMARPWSG
jgi:hypothetical protein